MQAEGLTGEKASEFMAKESRFIVYFVSGEWEQASKTLDEMKALSAHGKAKVYEMALKASQKEFDQAEKIARSLPKEARQNQRIQKATQSLTRLTQGRETGEKAYEKTKSGRFTNSSQGDRSVPVCWQEGERIGSRGWVLTSMIGTGGMGEVWKSTNLRQTEGALKLMLPSLSNDQSFLSVLNC